MTQRGAFVVLEGGEGSGKSTQAKRLAARVRDIGREVVETFEPGDTALGLRIRELVLHADEIDAYAELLLLAADRAEHVASLVRPALARGAVVVSDRFSPSTIVYQGVARGLGVDAVREVCAIAEHGVVPDAVVVLDVPGVVAQRRVSRSPDRLERAGEAFHAAVRQAYRDLAPRFGWTLLDGAGSVDSVATLVWEAVAPAVHP